MDFLKRHSLKLIFLSFIAVSAVAGWGIPWLHEWSGTQQSQRSPVIIRLGIGLLAGGIALLLLLPGLWNPRHSQEPDNQLAIPFWFTIRRVLVVIVLAAILMGSVSYLAPAASRFLCSFGMLCYGGWLMRKTQPDRWSVVALVSCMFLPYLWLARDRSVIQMLEIQAMILGGGLPAFIPQLLIGEVTGQRTVEWFWMGALLTALQLRVGFWMIRLGPERTISFLVYSLLASLFGSFVLYEGLRV